MARRRADAAIGVLDQSGFGQGGGFKALNLLTATVNKKAREGDMLSAAESERIVGFETGSVGGDDPELRRSGEF
jgi:hypothetical protein